MLCVKGYAKYFLIESSVNWELQQYYCSHYTVEDIEISKTLSCLPKIRLPVGIDRGFNPGCFVLLFISRWLAMAVGFLRGPESSRI